MSILERLGLKSASPKENSSSENEELAHDANNKRFTLAVGGDIAELTYAYSDKTKVYTFNHTGVPKAFRGRGKGAALAEVFKMTLLTI
jgi:predicted GNAT family acetyltransferase